MGFRITLFGSSSGCCGNLHSAWVLRASGTNKGNLIMSFFYNLGWFHGDRPRCRWTERKHLRLVEPPGDRLKIKIHWRHQRNSCSSLGEWLEGVQDFVSAACREYKITPPAAVPIPHSPPQPQRTAVKFEDYPPLPWHPEEHQWDDLSRRIWVQVDCLGVADVSQGDAVLREPRLEPIFRRITDGILQLSTLGWSPKRETDQYIIWARRHLNTVPDHLANAAMDSGSTWEWSDTDRLQAARANNGSLRICVDGGFRGASLGAIAFSVHVAPHWSE